MSMLDRPVDLHTGKTFLAHDKKAGFRPTDYATEGLTDRWIHLPLEMQGRKIMSVQWRWET